VAPGRLGPRARRAVGSSDRTARSGPTDRWVPTGSSALTAYWVRTDRSDRTACSATDAVASAVNGGASAVNAASAAGTGDTAAVDEDRDSG
jgi:hypothetical protein